MKTTVIGVDKITVIIGRFLGNESIRVISDNAASINFSAVAKKIDLQDYRKKETK